MTSNELDCVRIKFCTNQGYSFKVKGKMKKRKSFFCVYRMMGHMIEFALKLQKIITLYVFIVWDFFV